jgi:hypothetical protein
MNDEIADTKPAATPGYLDILPSLFVCVAAVSLLLVAHGNVA